jgi:hypothetical protein
MIIIRSGALETFHTTSAMDKFATVLRNHLMVIINNLIVMAASAMD